MEPEITTMGGNKKKLLVIALVAVLVIAGMAVCFLFVQKENTPPLAEVAPIIVVKKVYSQAEKMQILANLSATVPTDNTSQAGRIKILNSLAKNVPVDTTTTTEEKMKILQELAANTGQ